jgi:tRNA-splicing ligase RtcB (3'-phosphate/5'-hydroxy nucleic acid ligase)
MFEIQGKYTNAKVFATEVEDEAKSQIEALCNQSWLEGCNIAIQADAHAGKGCTIGTTIALQDKVTPSLVGADLGCGMLVVNIPDEFDINFAEVDAYISTYANNNQVLQYDNLYDLFSQLYCKKALHNIDYLALSCGTLGAGNHFCEIDKNAQGQRQLVIHSGSRNLGQQVAEHYLDLADEYCNHSQADRKAAQAQLILDLKAQGRQKEIQAQLEAFRANYSCVRKLPKELCYLEGETKVQYLHDAVICNKYARLSRLSLAKRILEVISHGQVQAQEMKDSEFSFQFEDGILATGFETIHNYIGEDNILRKGAISAHKGEKVIIPINMRDGSIIAIGKGNPDYNYSGPHGAGRLMSRTAAKTNLVMQEFQTSMRGIYTSSVDEATIDEAPMAYKPIESILANIQDTVEVIDIIKPIYNYKAH